MGEFRGLPCLWKVKCKSYHSREMKDTASFRKEQKKVQQCKKSGMSTQDACVPKLWFNQDLLFLVVQEEALQGLSNLDEESDLEDLLETLQETDDDTESITQRSHSNIEQLTLLRSSRPSGIKNFTEQRTESVCRKKKINESLFEAELGNLSRTILRSRICVIHQETTATNHHKTPLLRHPDSISQCEYRVFCTSPVVLFMIVGERKRLIQGFHLFCSEHAIVAYATSSSTVGASRWLSYVPKNFRKGSHESGN
ncbi:hypothetical protein PR048_020937 [Dryococelus australis]|uniref:Uncharacterized protein n=1 Tax=Dryococelus australis TaxID=614101 RepID=A0ABQ9GWU2_9NEOP|nr:hypothetical protein PR048_020937 [Dryococelus australis]